ncbi:MAG: GNAT family N-acetyltransferase [Roseimicrobium sp.]
MSDPDVRLCRLGGTENDVQAICEVLASAPSYSVAISGALPSPKDAASVFSSRPPGLPAERKHVYGIYCGTQLVGMADVLQGYPSRDIAYIGLLLITESFQGKGLGRSSHQRICLLARDWGCQRIRLAVVEANHSATGFWLRCGYSDTGVRVPYRCGTVHSQSMIFEMALLDDTDC